MAFWFLHSFAELAVTLAAQYLLSPAEALKEKRG